HRHAEIAAGSGPARRIDAGRAAERGDDQSGIVGESRQLRDRRCGMDLERRVRLEGRAGFLGFGETKLGSADNIAAVRCKQRGDLDHLAVVVAGDYQPAAREPARHRAYRKAVSCSRVSSAMPARARFSIEVKLASSNGSPSAVAWISMIFPLPVSTKL